MKHTFKKLFCLLLALAALLTLAACGKKEAQEKKVSGSSEDLSGTYLLYSVKWDGDTYKGEDIDDELDIESQDTYVKLKRKGSGTLVISGEKTNVLFNDDELWHKDDEDASFDLSVKNGKLTIKNYEYDGEEMTFVFKLEDEEPDPSGTTVPTSEYVPAVPDATALPDDVPYFTEEILATIAPTEAPMFTEPTEAPMATEPMPVETMPLPLETFPVEAADITGIYYLDYMEIEGEVFTAEELAVLGIDTAGCYLELQADGSGVMIILDEKMDMGWGDGKIWPADAADEAIPLTVVDGALTIEEDGAKMVFQK